MSDPRLDQLEQDNPELYEQLCADTSVEYVNEKLTELYGALAYPKPNEDVAPGSTEAMQKHLASQNPEGGKSPAPAPTQEELDAEETAMVKAEKRLAELKAEHPDIAKKMFNSNNAGKEPLVITPKPAGAGAEAKING